MIFKRRPCPSCEVLREVIREQEKRNKELILLLKSNFDDMRIHNQDITDAITGKNIQRRDAVTTAPVTRPTRRQRLRNAEKTDREIAEAEKRAGMVAEPDGK